MERHLLYVSYGLFVFMCLVLGIHLKETKQQIASNFKLKFQQKKITTSEEEKIIISPDQVILFSNIIPIFSCQYTAYSNDESITYNHVKIELLFDITIIHKVHNRYSFFQFTQNGMVASIYYKNISLFQRDDNSYISSISAHSLNNITFSFGDLETIHKYRNLQNNITYIENYFFSKVESHINTILAVYPISVSYSYFLEFLKRLKEPKTYNFNKTEVDEEITDLKVITVLYNEDIVKRGFDTIVYSFKIEINYITTAWFQTWFTFKECIFGNNVICTGFYPRNDNIERALDVLYAKIFKSIVN